MPGESSKEEAGSLKARLRRRHRDALGELDAERRRTGSAAARRRVLDLPEVRAASRLFCCLSFGIEIDTWGLVDEVLASGRTVWVPRASLPERRLHWHAFPCELETLSFGLRQPAATTPAIADDELTGEDVVVIPGLAFDLAGYRLGHGGGFFDRFLAAAPPIPIGLAFEGQIVDRLPRQEHDRPMRRVVTDLRTITAG